MPDTTNQVNLCAVICSAVLATPRNVVSLRRQGYPDEFQHIEL